MEEIKGIVNVMHVTMHDRLQHLEQGLKQHIVEIGEQLTSNVGEQLRRVEETLRHQVGDVIANAGHGQVAHTEVHQSGLPAQLEALHKQVASSNREKTAAEARAHAAQGQVMLLQEQLDRQAAATLAAEKAAADARAEADEERFLRLQAQLGASVRGETSEAAGDTVQVVSFQEYSEGLAAERATADAKVQAAESRAAAAEAAAEAAMAELQRIQVRGEMGNRSVSITVNGLSGYVCSVEATGGWSVQQVRQAIAQALEVPESRLVLLNGAERLGAEVRISQILRDPAVTVLTLTLIIHQAPQGPVTFVGCSNGLQLTRPGCLRKMGEAGGWSATGVSSEGFQVGEGRGLRFRPAQTDRIFMVGLGSQSACPGDHHGIEYGVSCGIGGDLVFCERGASKFKTLRKYTTTSSIEIRVSDRVEFFLDNQLEYVCVLRGQMTLFAMASFYSTAAEAADIEWL